MYKYHGYIRGSDAKGGELRGELECVRSDYPKECRTMAEASAERLMLRGDIVNGAYIHIVEQHGGTVMETYYWPQIGSDNAGLRSRQYFKR